MKTITTNFSLLVDNNLHYIKTKEIESSKLSDFILNFYGQINIGRSKPHELDICIVTYCEDDRIQIEEQIIQL